MVYEVLGTIVQGAVGVATQGPATLSAWGSTISTASALLLLLCIALAMVLTPRRLEDEEGSQEFQKDGKLKLRHNLDWAPERRKIYQEFENVRQGLGIEGPAEGVVTKEEFVVNSRGVELFTKSWLPESGKPKALVCFCHGYGDTVTFFFEGIARRLAAAQYAVFGIDYEGFGLSSGLHGYIEDFDLLVDDVIEYYSSVRERPEFKGLSCFLFGESMGGAVALKTHLREPNAWDGAVLVAPMCKIADDMCPPWIMIQILKALVPVFPRSKIIPNRNLAAHAFRDPEKLRKTSYNVIGYGDRPRLRTAWELLVTTYEIEERMKDVSLPLLILHGAADRVTDPSVSKALYDNAKSEDKKLYLYEGVWHAILEGEPDELINKVMGDISSWLDSHCKQQQLNSSELQRTESSDLVECPEAGEVRVRELETRATAKS